MQARVTYDGTPIAQGAPTAEEKGGVMFITCESPMPVGTEVTVQLERGGPRAARVVRVEESAERAGMAVEWIGDPTPTLPPPPADEPGTVKNEGGRGRRRRRRN
jgi:hypothetical protein